MNRSGITAALTAPLLLLSSLGGPLAAQAPPAEPQPETFQGEIEVREIGIVVAPPQDKSLAGVRPAAGRLVSDGRILTKASECVVTKAATEPAWRLPGIAERFGVDKRTAAPCAAEDFF